MTITKDKSFKTRVAETAILCSKIYQERFVQYDYLVCSEAFGNYKYQIIKAEKNNYLHLLGVHTSISADEFYNKCISGTLEADDFDFIKNKQSEKSVKGSVRQKINALPNMLDMFSKELYAEMNFKKNDISCSFATADDDFTIGFVKEGRPKSLMRKNQLNITKCKPVDLVMRKRRTDNKYTEIIYGDLGCFEDYKIYLDNLI